MGSQADDKSASPGDGVLGVCQRHVNVDIAPLADLEGPLNVQSDRRIDLAARGDTAPGRSLVLDRRAADDGVSTDFTSLETAVIAALAALNKDHPSQTV
jgi:hypothetical protein